MTQNISPPKGTRDFPPEVMILRQRIFSKLEKIYRQFGFDPIETPIVEYWEVLKGKYGDEAENRLIWRFKLPYSDKEYALRYDLTVPLARFFARFRPKLPFKRYAISRVYRYENPQKGRYREFWQADFDIIGSKEPIADAEVLLVVDKVFREFNFDNYIIKINDRRLLREIFEKEIGIPENLILDVYRAIDKLDKIGLEGVKKELEKLNLSNDLISKIIEIISITGSPQDITNILSNKFKENKQLQETIDNIEGILEFLPEKVLNRIKLDLSLVRGLDYYTGLIFEAIVTEPKIGSLSGGGRYDNLIKLFANEDVPAVGGSIGVERLIDAGLELGIFKLDKKTYTEIGVIWIGNTYKEAWKIANKLREEGYNTYIDLMNRDFRKQMDYIIEKDIRYLVIVGERDLKENKVTIQDRYKNIRKRVNAENLIQEISNLVGR